MTGEPARVARYARAVERALARSSGRAVVMSPRDFSLLTGWLARGVPLALVLEQIELRRSTGRDVRSLAPIAAAVERAWGAVVDGRSETTRGPEPRAPEAAVPESPDETTLLSLASPESVAEAERETDRALAPWRARMTPAAYASTRRRAILDHLRARRSC